MGAGKAESPIPLIDKKEGGPRRASAGLHRRAPGLAASCSTSGWRSRKQKEPGAVWTPGPQCNSGRDS